MEKNKQDLNQDTFLKKYVQEIALDTTNVHFTNSIMKVLLQEEKKVVIKVAPLISKKRWGIALGVLATCIWFLVKGKKTSIYKLPSIDTQFLYEFQMPDLFNNLSVSSTMLTAIVVFSLMVFVQIVYLKNHFNKRFD